MSVNNVSRSVQFLGAEAVERAYQNRDVPAWAIFCNSQFMFKYEGSKMAEGLNTLSKTMDELNDVGSPAVYTLKVYEDLTGKIKNNTPDDGSFNFRLTETTAGNVGSIGGDGKRILDVLQGMNLRLEQLEQGGTDQDEDAIGKIERVMEIPGIRELVSGLVGKLTGAAPPARAPAMAGSDAVEYIAPVTPMQLTVSDQLLTAIRTLNTADPELEMHLTKLADIAKDSPAKFKMLVAML